MFAAFDRLRSDLHAGVLILLAEHPARIGLPERLGAAHKRREPGEASSIRAAIVRLGVQGLRLDVRRDLRAQTFERLALEVTLDPLDPGVFGVLGELGDPTCWFGIVTLGLLELPWLALSELCRFWIRGMRLGSPPAEDMSLESTESTSDTNSVVRPVFPLLP